MSVQIDGSTGNIIAIKADYSGDVSIGGTLTYEDVTNIDAVGLITARSGVKFGASGTTVVGNSSGIGVGTDNPSYLVDAHTSSGSAQLRVKSGGDLAQIFLESTDTSGYSQINFADADSSNIGMLQYFHSDNHMEFTVNGSEAARIDSSGRLLLGTTTEGDGQADNFTIADSANCGITIRSGTSNKGQIYFSDSTSGGGESIGRLVYSHNDNAMFFTTNSSERMRIDSSGNMGLGTDSPGEILDIIQSAQGDAATLRIRNSADSNASTNVEIVARQASRTGGRIVFGRENANSWSSAAGYADGFISFNPTDGGSDVERMRIDSSGRLLIGSTSARTNFNNGSASPQIQIENASNGNKSSIALIHNENALTDSSAINFAKTRGGSIGDNSALNQEGDRLGAITFQGNDGTEFVQAASIEGFTDASPGNNDMPGRLVFSTTSDGGSSVTERARLDSGGNWLVGKGSNFDSTSLATAGAMMMVEGSFNGARSSGSALNINRLTNDGNLAQFYQDTNIQGSISVSGSTVSYNGAHLARWSQLPGGAERTEILRGSVLSNLDEMCEWGDESNEQLNRMKVSDVEGDINVAGVFQDWDDDDDTYTNDFYCAMTGDFVIRIASGVTVQRGNLLMSAGDGTAKPQGDGYIQDKTIAKVTSTTVSTTYSDGSYCVPCVLMAC